MIVRVRVWQARESVAGEREKARACVCVNVCVAGERERVRVCVCERVCVCGGRECVRVCVCTHACVWGGGEERSPPLPPSPLPTRGQQGREEENCYKQTWQ